MRRILKIALGTLTIILRVVPAALGIVATVLAIGYLNLYPVLVIDTMWAPRKPTPKCFNVDDGKTFQSTYRKPARRKDWQRGNAP